MEKFIERQNIARFTTLLMTETDTAKRELLQQLLTDEMVRQAGLSDAKNKVLIDQRSPQSTASFCREALFGAVARSEVLADFCGQKSEYRLNSIIFSVVGAVCRHETSSFPSDSTETFQINLRRQLA